MDVLWGKDKVLELGSPQVLSLKNFFADKKSEELFAVSFGMGNGVSGGYLIVERNFFYFLYSFIFGGNHFVEKIAPLSKMEKNYFEQFVQDFLAIATQAWKSLGAYSFKVENYILEAEAISKISSLNDFVLCRFDVVSGESKYGFSLLYPKDLLATFDEARSSKAVGAELQKDADWASSVLNAISTTTHVKVEAELGSVQLLLREALNMQVGQILPLVLNDKGHLVSIDGNPAFLGKMGSVGESRAVQIIASDEIN